MTTPAAGVANLTAKLVLRAALYPLEGRQGRVVALPCDTLQGGLELMRKLGSHLTPEVRWGYVGVIEEQYDGTWRQVLFDCTEETRTQANAWRVLGFSRKEGERGVVRAPVLTPRVFIERVYGTGPFEAEGWVAGRPFYFSLEGKEFAFSVARDPQADPRLVGKGWVDGFHTMQPYSGLHTASGQDVTVGHQESKRCPCIWCKLAAAADIVRVCCAAFLAERA